MKLIIMKRLLRIVCLSVCLLLHTTETEAQTTRFNNSILWEIRKTDSSEPSYLLGTHHQLDTSKYSVPMDTFIKLISRCGRLATEVDFQYLKDNHIAVSEKKPDWYRHLNRKRKKAFKKICKDLGYPPMFVNYVKKHMTLTEVTYFLHFNRIQHQDSSVVYLRMDFSLNDYAVKSNRISVLSLEDPVKHMSYLDVYSPESLTTLTLNKLLDSFYNQEAFRKMEVADSLKFDYYGQVFNQAYAKPVFRHKEDSIAWNLTIQRNYDMVETIDSMMSINKPLFAAVGCGHLFGEKGMLNILQQKGYIIRPYRVEIRKK